MSHGFRIKRSGVECHVSFLQFRCILQTRLLIGYLLGGFWSWGESKGWLPTYLNDWWISASCSVGWISQVGICLSQCISFPVLYLAGLRRSGFYHTAGVWNFLFCFLHGIALSLPIQSFWLIKPGYRGKWLFVSYLSLFVVLHILYSRCYLSAMRGIDTQGVLSEVRGNGAKPPIPQPQKLFSYIVQMLSCSGAALVMQFLMNTVFRLMIDIDG